MHIRGEFYKSPFLVLCSMQACLVFLFSCALAGVAQCGQAAAAASAGPQPTATGKPAVAWLGSVSYNNVRVWPCHSQLPIGATAISHSAVIHSSPSLVVFSHNDPATDSPLQSPQTTLPCTTPTSLSLLAKPRGGSWMPHYQLHPLNYQSRYSRTLLLFPLDMPHATRS